MAEELQIIYDTGATLTAKVYGNDDAVLATVAFAETPAASGTYVGDFPAIVAGDYEVEYFDGADVIGAHGGEGDKMDLVAAFAEVAKPFVGVDVPAVCEVTNTHRKECRIIGDAGWI